jgi:hypothetical protein
MALRKARPLKLSPRGLSDALDSTNVQEGAMQQLSNLIPDPTTADLWECRPASQQLATLSSGGQQGNAVTSLQVLGTRAYGTFGAVAGTFNGHDIPFSYNIVSNTFDTITGITAANTPTSPALTGAWVPPTSALIGTKLIFTHPGFNGSGNGFFGILDISTPTAPVWSSGNTSGTVVLSAPPNWVEQFNGRAYYLINPPNGQPVAVFSDSLSPLTTSGATLSVLTFGDNQTLTAASGLPLFNQLGGIIQSLMVFKSVSNIYQVTGDAATSNLTINSLNVATGTLAPNSISSTPKGLMFIAPDGLRLIDFQARVSDPIGVDGQGVNLPFISALVPSRINASCNFNVFRIFVQNGQVAGSPNQEYWFDISRSKWSGSHTFAGAMIAPYQNTFLIWPAGNVIKASLWQSDVTQTNTSSFTENGVPMTWSWQTCPLPDTGEMAEHCLIESTLNLGLSAAAGVVNVFAQTQDGTVLDSVSVMPSTGGTAIWGAFNWGAANWGSAIATLFPQQLQWHKPLVFQRLTMLAQGSSAQGVKIGDLRMRYQTLGYLGAAPLILPAPPTLPVPPPPPPPPPPSTGGAFSDGFSSGFSI